MNTGSNNVNSSLYSEKGQEYFSKTRENIVALLPDGPNKILEIGCGFGNTLVEAKRRGKAIEIVGTDINDLQVSTDLDAFIVGNIETVSLPYPAEYFDAIILADVLEHLQDPWHALKNVSNYLKKGGICIISIPNIRELRTIGRILLKGRFEYRDCGILDKTHLRFFCKKDIVQLVHDEGLKIDKIDVKISPRRKLFNSVTLGFFEDILVDQYFIRSIKNSSTVTDGTPLD